MNQLHWRTNCNGGPKNQLHWRTQHTLCNWTNCIGGPFRLYTKVDGPTDRPWYIEGWIDGPFHLWDLRLDPWRIWCQRPYNLQVRPHLTGDCHTKPILKEAKDQVLLGQTGLVGLGCFRTFEGVGNWEHLRKPVPGPSSEIDSNSPNPSTLTFTGLQPLKEKNNQTGSPPGHTFNAHTGLSNPPLFIKPSWSLQY